ncbi:MAG: addiction module toxin RelE [Epulopiscium sp. Nele67-Bin004]|nr:MAG: addiction module toxin RelE [Epulopiscium sp. Nele67-Bin004]
MYELEFYSTEKGVEPIREFLDSLTPKLRAKAIRDLEILQEYGNNLREPHSKYIEDGIFELRIKFSSDIARIFYFFIVGNKIILTNGFIKKQQKTPKREIERAKTYKKEFERRQCND